MQRRIDYGNLMHRAMRTLIAEVLGDVAKHGLPGDHHFFISFDTNHPDVKIADWLHERYPDEMTIVLQYWFEDLDVRDDGFTVTLNFGDKPEPLVVPYDALLTFADPSVEFGLRFETKAPDDDGDDNNEAPHLEITDDGKAEADVVSLDSFRK